MRIDANQKKKKSTGDDEVEIRPQEAPNTTIEYDRLPRSIDPRLNKQSNDMVHTTVNATDTQQHKAPLMTLAARKKAALAKSMCVHM